jgi:glutamate racemase
MSAAHVKLGVLDWGIGGLGVVAAVRRLRVNVPLLYLSDTGATPYGKLPRRALAQRVDRAIENLRERGATHVLVACNAASTVISEVTTPLPVYGVIEPALAELSARAPLRIGVIGGARTVRSGLYRRGLLAARHEVTQRVAQPLSAYIESAAMSSPAAARDLVRIVKPLQRVELLVLACTHYPAIAEQIQAQLPGVELFDPAQAVGRSVARALLRTPRGPRDGTVELLCTGDARAMRTAATRAWGRDPGPCRAVVL